MDLAGETATWFAVVFGAISLVAGVYWLRTRERSSAVTALLAAALALHALGDLVTGGIHAALRVLAVIVLAAGAGTLVLFLKRDRSST